MAFELFVALMHLILFDTPDRNQLYPFTHTRPVADIRCGIHTLRERWEHHLDTKSGTLTEAYLQQAFPVTYKDTANTYVHSSVFCNTALATAVKRLQPGDALISDDILIALCTAEQLTYPFQPDLVTYNLISYKDPIRMLHDIWEIFSFNEAAIREDFNETTRNRVSRALPEYVTAINPENIFVEEGARVYPCIINASAGPVYIGKDAEIMEGCLLRGPLALCDHSTLKMGAKIYGATTIGPGCKVGGEVNNAVFFANSNKGHDGFLGNAVIGEWCNLGADTNCSNLKNNYDTIKIWNEYQQKSMSTGLQFCGLMMGDHSKCGINTMFNTGTVAGVSCNIYGAGFPEKFIPSFSWGGSEGMVTYTLKKAMDTANRMMERRNLQLSEAETDILKYVYEHTEKQRSLLGIKG